MAVSSDQLVKELRKTIPNRLSLKNVVFVCIGTDRSTGDSLGPLVGTYLEAIGFTNVLGTVDDPVHAMNLEEKLIGIDSKKKIIAIDACLGQVHSVGAYQAQKGPLKPGAGVNKDLPPVGNYHITGIVNVGGFMEYFVLQNTRLSLVMKMAREIVHAIMHVLPPLAFNEVAAGNDNDLNDYAEEEGRLRQQKRFDRMLINNDPFYPQAYHEQDVKGWVGINDNEEGET